MIKIRNIKWKCFLGRHDWVFSSDYVNFSSSFETIDLECPTRYCNRCGKKQIRKWSDWETWNSLTKSEKRHKNLTKLGI